MIAVGAFPRLAAAVGLLQLVGVAALPQEAAAPEPAAPESAATESAARESTAPESVAPVPAAADLLLLAPDRPVLLGEAFHLVVRGPGLLDLRVDPGAHRDDVLVGQIERRTAGGEVELRLALRLARQGPIDLPLSVVRADGERAALPPVRIEVALDVPPGRTPRVAALLAPLDIPLPPASTRVFLAAALVALAALAAWIVRSTRKVLIVVPPTPADQLALEALERLRLHLPRTSEEMLPFTLEVSDVLRNYLERGFLLHAPARTTEEFLREASQRQDVVGARRDILARFLTDCDLVKYARHRPLPAAAGGLLATVENFVEETREASGVPPAQVASSGGAAR